MNEFQKIIVLPIDATTEALINDKLALGFVIQSITELTSVNKLLIVYATPEII